MDLLCQRRTQPATLCQTEGTLDRCLHASKRSSILFLRRLTLLLISIREEFKCGALEFACRNVGLYSLALFECGALQFGSFYVGFHLSRVRMWGFRVRMSKCGGLHFDGLCGALEFGEL